MALSASTSAPPLTWPRARTGGRALLPSAGIRTSSGARRLPAPTATRPSNAANDYAWRNNARSLGDHNGDTAGDRGRGNGDAAEGDHAPCGGDAAADDHASWNIDDAGDHAMRSGDAAGDRAPSDSDATTGEGAPRNVGSQRKSARRRQAARGLAGGVKVPGGRSAGSHARAALAEGQPEPGLWGRASKAAASCSDLSGGPGAPGALATAPRAAPLSAHSRGATLGSGAGLGTGEPNNCSTSSMTPRSVLMCDDARIEALRNASARSASTGRHGATTASSPPSSTPLSPALKMTTRGEGLLEPRSP